LKSFIFKESLVALDSFSLLTLGEAKGGFFWEGLRWSFSAVDLDVVIGSSRVEKS